MIFLMLFTLVLAAVEGIKPHLEVSASGGVQDLSIYGVDAESCKRMVYQVKACRGHVMFLLDAKGTQLVRFLTGVNRGNFSSFTLYPADQEWRLPTNNLLHCDEFRWFWMSWDAGRLKYGKGRVPEEDVILDLQDPTGSQVKRIALSRANLLDASIKLGETDRGRFARLLQGGKFSHGMIAETSNSREICATLCSEHVDCGMFSYNQDLGLCAIFDRMTSSFNVTSEEGWRSWKLLYCYP